MDKFSTESYFEKLNKYFNAANYLSVAQLYLKSNPLMREHELCMDDIKSKLVGHWGTIPGQNFIYTHCNRAISKYDVDMILLSGPGHGGNFLTSNCYLEGTYSKFYPELSQDLKGMTKLCKQFSFPGGIGSHCIPEIPGSVHEGGELGYTLAHAYGAVFDNPNLIAVAVVGDGEAETGPLATSWHSNKFINLKRDGVVLPILHLNGYKISGPTMLARLPKDEITSLFDGYGYEPVFVEGDNPEIMHKKMAKAMDFCLEKIAELKKSAHESENYMREKLPMIILRSPKGWTCPLVVNGLQIEDSFRAHQIPLTIKTEEDLKLLKEWLESYKPNELFDENYKLKAEIQEILPPDNKKMCASPYANGGLLLKELITPNLDDYAVKFDGHGTVKKQDMLELGGYIRDLFRLNRANKNYRIFSPDEANSNRLYKVFEEEKRMFADATLSTDENLSPTGRVMDAYLSEHMCEGWLEGYLLTGRHGMFDSYEAFVRVVDSMVAQHAKWVKTTKTIPWRKDISSLNLILTSNVWQQDHNGFTHQDPGFLGHVGDKNPELIRLYLPADANCLITVFDHCSKTKNRVNGIVASKHPSYQWLSMDEAKKHCEKGIAEWEWAGLNDSKNPDVVIASAGDTPTIEALATVKLIKEFLPKLNVKFVNVVSLTKLLSNASFSGGLTDEQFNELLTTNKPVIFNFHGYANLIHNYVYARENKKFIVSGYREEGTITTAFDMRVRNEIDRYHLLLKVAENCEISEEDKQKIRTFVETQLKKHNEYIIENGVDLPEIENWNWND